MQGKEKAILKGNHEKHHLNAYNISRQKKENANAHRKQGSHPDQSSSRHSLHPATILITSPGFHRTCRA